MGNMSVATMRLLPPMMRAAYWLQPPGAAPKSTHANSRPQQPLGFLNLRELEDRARSPAFLLRAFDELIVGVFGEPAGTAFCALGHFGLRL